MGKGAKRAVYVNGLYCESMADAAGQSSAILGKQVQLYQIQRILDGILTINGLEIKEKPILKRKKAVYTPPVKKHDMLLRYPIGERPTDRGLPFQWR